MTADKATAGQAARRPPRATSITLWVLQILLATYMLFGSAAPMFTGEAHIAETFRRIGFGHWFQYFTAFVEAAGAIGMLLPRFAGLAALGLIGVMTGAVATELTFNGPGGAALPALLGVMFAVVAWKRWAWKIGRASCRERV